MRNKIAAATRFCAASGLATTLVMALTTEWVAGHVRNAALGVATWATGRMRALKVQPPVYLHWPRVLGYIVAPLGLWVLIIWGVASFVRWVF